MKTERDRNKMGKDEEREKVIHSVSEFVANVESFQQTIPSMQNIGCFTMFRGQANKDWPLMPSLYRQDLLQGEQLLIKYLQHSCPDEFSNSRFDTLVKLQHFGLPTRLLDTTTNPLVALYFACKSDRQMDSDGVVYVFPNLPVMWSNDPLIELIMDFVFCFGNYRIDLQHALNNMAPKYNNAYSRLIPHDIKSLLHYLTAPALAVMPEKSNKRILAQDGAFFLCGMKVAAKEISTNPGTRGREYYIFEPVEIKGSTAVWSKAESIIIPSTAKETILRQLDVMGVNEAKLFPDLQHQANHAVEYVKRNIHIRIQAEKETDSKLEQP